MDLIHDHEKIQQKKYLNKKGILEQTKVFLSDGFDS
jgi:hypothetical protein